MANPAKSDSELARNAAAGDQAAFITLVERHQGMVSGVALSLMKNVAASEDIAQETFLSAWKKIGGLHDSSKVRPWLATIARNTALSHLRMKKNKVKSQELEETIGDSALGPDQVSAHKDDLSLVLQTLERLPEKYRTPLVLFYREDQSVAAVAEALGLSKDATKQRLKRGRDELRGQVESTLSQTLRRTAPTAAFTASVAGVLTTMAPPAASAAAGLSLSSVTTSSGAASTTVAAMNTSKLSLTAAALIGLVAIPAGYGVGGLVTKKTSHLSLKQTGAATDLNKSFVPRESIIIPASQTAEEWKRLRDLHGTTASSFPLIANEIMARTDGFLKSALVATLAAEWARVDGQSGYEYGQQRGVPFLFRRLLTDEWIKLEPSAVIAVYKDSEWGLDSSAFLPALSSLAHRHPALFRETLGSIPFASGTNNKDKEQALKILAEANPIALRDAALKLEGREKEIVLGAALSEWALEDGEGALKWVLKNLEKNSNTQKEAIYETLRGWAQVNPYEALNQLQVVLKKNSFKEDSADLLSYLSSGILVKMAEIDFSSAMAWWGKNQKVIRANRTNGHFNDFLLNQLAKNPAEVLSALSQNGLMDSVENVFRQTQNNQDYSPKWREIAEALVSQPDSKGKSALLLSLSTKLIWSTEPENAIELLRIIKSSGTSAETSGLAAQKNIFGRLLRNGGLAKAEEFAREYPDWAQGFREQALQNFVLSDESSPQSSPEEFEALLEISEGLESREFQKIVESLTEKYMARNPEEAFEWIDSLPDELFKDSSREVSAATAFDWWASSNRQEALQWIEGADLDSYPSAVRQSFAQCLALWSPNLELFWPLFQMTDSPGYRGRLVEYLARDKSRGVEEILAELESQPIAEAEKARLEERFRQELIK